MSFHKTTAILCTSVLLLVAIYDGVVVGLSDNINDSVSIWFASYSAYCVPVFTCAFLLGHFFGIVADKFAKIPANMVWWKMWITTTLISVTCYDVICAHVNVNHMVSNLPLISLLNGWNMTLMVVGLFAGKYLGTMDKTKPAGDK